MERLLIAEDEKLIRRGLSAIVGRSPVEVAEIVECRNGEEAWEYLQNNPVDVLFTDVRMPKMDGLTLARKIHEELETPWPRPEIVIVSGYDDFNYAVEAMRYGSREYILKPVKRERVVETLQKLDELVKNRVESEQRQESYEKVGLTQLKYALSLPGFSPGFSEDELSALKSAIGGLLGGGEFVVLCCNRIPEIPEEYVVLKLENIGPFQIVVVPGGASRKISVPYAGASRAFRDFGGLRPAFEQAADARKYAFFTGLRSVEAGSYSFREEGFLPQRPPAQLARKPGSREYAELVHLLNSLFTQAARGRLYPHIFEEFILKLIDSLADAFDFVPGDGQLAGLREIYGYGTVDDYRLAFLEWLDRLHARVFAEIESSRNMDRIAEAVGFVNENYGKSLNMAVVSNHVSMNYSVFSRLFKEYTGENFVDYLRGLRLKKAAELLVTTDMKISEISSTVGFDSDKYFMRSFKAAYGSPPTPYRKAEQLKKRASPL